MSKHRQIRVQISGGIDDVVLLSEKIKKFINSPVEGNLWGLTFEETTRFGKAGPLHKTKLGFTQNS